jgi:hypothetical protein
VSGLPVPWDRVTDFSLAASTAQTVWRAAVNRSPYRALEREVQDKLGSLIDADFERYWMPLDDAQEYESMVRSGEISRRELKTESQRVFAGFAQFLNDVETHSREYLHWMRKNYADVWAAYLINERHYYNGRGKESVV